jgi:RNA polymerase subunit RPABC4/transcription elongation factor Spt4
MVKRRPAVACPKCDRRIPIGAVPCPYCGGPEEP